ncbi:LytR C-terminal domain-containing protein [Actinosynnema sp. NPDC047251]|uniref:Putative membrane protein n=1 Tax=Saccharothrix espanaensis (strain ATCC 51144 / DSM 44229 / JCM 9112 / NBRC 15066 / NRRL 15764) TaxID=1179773 RepID=K0JR75_SACES|nr:LytR C-terminal domain-containing protein [Saccharothrix espanaensis]CCH27797.1 putative membrane protein [Saccharothrix espanaensis DSM 44229]
MTNPEPAGSAHPARAAGYALIGVAAVAAVIGVTTLFTGGDDDQAGAPPTTSATAGPTTGGPSSDGRPSDGQPSGSTTSAPPQTTTGDTTAVPPATTTQAGSPPTTTAAPPPVTDTVKPPVRVYNNSNVSGLAHKASDDIRRAGWDVAETGNYSQGQIPTTTVYYRPGTAEERSAQQLGQVLKAEVKPRFDGIESAHEGIIVIVTNNYAGASGKI